MPSETIQLPLYLRLKCFRVKYTHIQPPVTALYRSTFWQWFTCSWIRLYFGRFSAFLPGRFAQACSGCGGSVCEQIINGSQVWALDLPYKKYFTFWLWSESNDSRIVNQVYFAECYYYVDVSLLQSYCGVYFYKLQSVCWTECSVFSLMIPVDDF